ncbi:MAG: hypothetical protein OEU93_16475 [Rubrivivax sp.]|nr:hypothetical protein [Rubrivivax sp.]MDH5339541.1 hypothetical protein [Rubrivivax sp.]
MRLAATLLLAAVCGASAAPVLPAVEPARAGTQCVEDPALMRRQHMNFLKHQRDETVHGGIRGAKHSLKDCVACHASAKTGSVAAAPTDFCVSCHSYAAVAVDCFECHAGKPATAVAGVKP